ncbi:MAG: T9SS type A sorting domain-containing protein [Candidatus Cloacimonetes bacterium]|nr:T9SS type A sorting domain-containing protein [Candidatus Cloacimonadota bacterium]MDY0172129.1 LamG-like jellyroll fold domain-containing protein [Candidatus Cloacimonadaceae bacterium]
MKHKQILLIIMLLAVAATSCFAANNAVRFNPGTPNDYISLGLNQYNQLFSGASGLTFEGWVKPASTSSLSRIFNILADGHSSAFALDIEADGSLSAIARSRNWEASPNSITANTVAGAIVAEEWYHIAVVVSYASGDKYIRIYIDGNATPAAQNNSPTFANTAYVSGTFSAYPNVDAFGRQVENSKLPYVGLMDEFRIWKYARTIAEIQADMNRELPAPYPISLIGYWKFNEGSGTTAFDSSASGIDGALLDGTDWADGNPTLPVELSSFTAVLTADLFVRLQWTTQSETGVSGFYIYRGISDKLADAIIVSPLIAPSNTGELQNYEFVDAELYDSGTYYYWLSVHNMDGSVDYYGPNTVLYNSNAHQDTPEIPLISGLSSVYPNPFNPSTTIAYGLAKDADVSFVIYNSRGQIVRQITEGQKAAGNWKLIWNGLDENADDCATGIYYIRMNAGKDSFVKKAALLK